MASAWLDVDHQGVVEGHWANGLANRLDGTEDHRMRGDAAEIFEKRHMYEERSKIVEQVREGAANGSFGLFWACTPNARKRTRDNWEGDITDLG